MFTSATLLSTAYHSDLAHFSFVKSSFTLENLTIWGQTLYDFGVFACVAWWLCLLEIVTVCKCDSLVFLVRHSAIVCVYRACLIVIDLCSVCIRRQQCIPGEHVSPQNGRYSMNRVKRGSAHPFICLNSKCWWPNSQTRLWEGNCCFVKKWLTVTDCLWCVGCAAL